MTACLQVLPKTTYPNIFIILFYCLHYFIILKVGISYQLTYYSTSLTLVDNISVH